VEFHHDRNEVPSLKLTAKATENRGPLEKEIQLFGFTFYFFGGENVSFREGTPPKTNMEPKNDGFS